VDDKQVAGDRFLRETHQTKGRLRELRAVEVGNLEKSLVGEDVHIGDRLTHLGATSSRLGDQFSLSIRAG
jgi:hypothetical protein